MDGAGSHFARKEIFQDMESDKEFRKNVKFAGIGEDCTVSNEKNLEQN